MDVKLTKLILKCIVIVVLSTTIEITLLAPLISRLATSLLAESGRLGAIIMLFLLAVLVPVISAVFVIGVLGGMWVGVKKDIGYIVASILGLIHLVPLISRHVISFDIPGLIILAGIPAIIFSGGLTYSKIRNWKQAKMAEQGS